MGAAFLILAALAVLALPVRALYARRRRARGRTLLRAGARLGSPARACQRAPERLWLSTRPDPGRWGWRQGL